MSRPDSLPAWRRYLRFWRSDPNADVADELRFHLESAVAEYTAAGMRPEAARAEAMRRFGDVEAIRSTLNALSHEQERAMEWRDRLDTLRSDVRFALRQLRKSPAFTLVAVLTLALGIGANSAIFSIVYSVLLRPLPYAHSDRLLSLRERNGPSDTQGMVVTYGNYGVWRERVRSFEAFAAYGFGGFTLTGAGEPRQIQVLRVSGDYWKALYVPPALGRYFTPAEDVSGAPNVVILSYRLWQSIFDGDSSIVGRQVMLSGTPFTVLGVASPQYTMPRVDGFVPLRPTAAQLQEHADHELQVIGLVRDGVPPERALKELTSIEAELAKDYPHSYFDGGIIAQPLRDAMVGSVRSLLLILLGAVGLVLLIACVNVANLLLARGAARRKEIAVRNALGAGRGRIVGQLLTESLLLSLGGAIIGLGVATFGLRFLAHANPLGVPRLEEAALNGPVVAFATLLAIACGIGFGLFPALRASRLDLQQTLRDGARTDIATMRSRIRSTLVVAQVSLAMVLLVGAGLLVRSALLMQGVDPGFDTRNLLITGMNLPNARYPSDTAASARLDQILGTVASLPGVSSAAYVTIMPMTGWGTDCNFRREGSTEHDGSFNANARAASLGFFHTLRIPLLQGRSFTAADVANTPDVVVINRRLAHRLFGDESPIGKRITCSSVSSTHPSWETVVGITGDLHARGLGEEIRDEVYSPLGQSRQRSLTLVIRGAVPVTTLAPSIRRAVGAIDPLLPLSGMMTMDEIIDRSLATPRFTSQLLAALGMLGLLLAVIGIYGVIAYFVAQRTNEIGIRMALGADTGRVIGMVVRQGIVLAALGVAMGGVASLLVTKALEQLLFGVTARDPLTFAVVAALLAAVSIVASFIPARRAARIDPLEALRGA
ncbi:MAG TPA: ABC transporter permease [Gemmatimonadaceae bacterium]|nr:ABC transporter permease [Gemmatimonadaceae bacterium]